MCLETPLKSLINLYQKLLIVKLQQLMEEELSIVKTKIKSGKVPSHNEIPTEELKTRKFDDILL